MFSFWKKHNFYFQKKKQISYVFENLTNSIVLLQIFYNFVIKSQIENRYFAGHGHSHIFNSQVNLKKSSIQ